MGEELTNIGGAPAEQPAAPAAPAIPAPEQTLAPEVQAAVDAAVAKTREEYEKVHIAKLKSGYDRRIAELQKQAEMGRQAKIQQAEMLESSGDTTAALRILKGAVAESYGQQEQEARAAQVWDWTSQRLAEFGLDAEKDEDVQATVKELDPLDPNFGYAFYYETGKLLKKRADDARKEAKTAISTVPEVVKAEVKKALAAGGLDPDLGTPSKGGEDELMKLPASRRIAEILKRERQAQGT